ncbi:MAG: F0F1 ATP synthase subunit B [Acidobacteriota bacterium]|nr:F0F1 ATP synthase subunit B [Acidobacteriota bacterium]
MRAPIKTVLGMLLLATTGVVAASGSEGGGGGNALLNPAIGTLFWTLITFALFAFILGKYAWPPLFKALQDREEGIASDLSKAESGRKEAEDLLRQQRELLEQARRERAESVAAGQKEAETLKTEILDEARQEREAMMKKTQQQIDAGIATAKAELRASTANLAIQAAEKLLTRNLDDAGQRKLVEDHLADLERGSGTGGMPS